ncbi:MAG: long-chain fatty acid--CoA ligase [Deltaproteobacteria bacterium]|nr:long-chain fatty acid--CoA ligase [Deltaproteobacteria bacterium]
MPHSIYELLIQSAQNHEDKAAIRYKKGQSWKTLTWREVSTQVHQIASKLIKMGIVPEDRIVLLSATRYEWVLADLAIIASGACTVPIYHSSVAKDASFIAKNSEAKLAIVEDAEQAAKLPGIETILITDLFGTPINMSEIQKRTQGVKPSEVASIVYTSGTTGEPKGACLTHDNLLYEAQAIERTGILSDKDIQLMFLPLAHVFARVMEIAWIKTAHVLCFAESIEKVVENMKEIKPTIMAAVPRIYEKIYAKILAKARSGGLLKKMLLHWALEQQKKPEGLAWTVAKSLVFDKIGAGLKETFGGRLRFFVSGGAPLNPEIAQFFDNAGVTILEGYGLTETSAATCVNLPASNRIGTVGRPLPGMEVKTAEDGEICIKGRGVFHGYWNRPEETKKVLSEDGWLKTGDIGVLDSSGYLKITDRKKDIIVTAAGKNIAPQKLENLLKTKTSLISQVIVCGDQHKYLVALVTLDEAVLKGFAKRKEIKGSYAELTQSQQALERIERAVESMNEGLASFEQLKKFKVLDHDFVVGDQLTPTLKVKRAYCVRKYAQEIDGLY